MLRHFILAIFLIALSLPAIAVATPSVNDFAASEDCHGMSSQDDEGGDPESGPRIHSCIGCVAPTNAAPPLAEPVTFRFIPFAELVVYLNGTSPRPSLPPPRT